jgi:hypothetical protein
VIVRAENRVFPARGSFAAFVMLYHVPVLKLGSGSLRHQVTLHFAPVETGVVVLDLKGDTSLGWSFTPLSSLSNLWPFRCFPCLVTSLQ